MTVNRGSHGSPDITPSDAALPVHSSQTLDTTESFGRQDILSDAELHEDFEGFGHEPLSTAGEMASSAGVSLQDTGSDTSCNLLSSGDHAAWFAHSLLTNVDLVSTKLPWEQGIFAELLNDGDGLPDIVPKIEISNQGQHNDLAMALEACRAEVSEAAQPHMAAGESAIYPAFVKSITDKDYAAKRTSLMDAAIKKLLIVLRHCMLASVAGRNFGLQRWRFRG